jgi:dipeptidyl aminopeptidase/acylaminoacyl peptidase
MTMRRRLYISIALCTLFLAACTPAPEPAPTVAAPPAQSVAATIPRYGIEQFMNTERLSGASFSADGARVLHSSNRSGVFNAYARPVDGGEATMLTDSTVDAVFALAFFPHDDRILYSSDQGGNELNHIYVREVDGSVRDLTPGENTKASFSGFSADGSRFWISTNERDPRYFDLYEYDAESYQRTLVYRNEDGVFLGPVAADGAHVALARVHTRANTDILLFDRARGDTRTLVADADEVANSAATFSADGAWLYYSSDRDGEFRQLRRIALADGRDEQVLAPDWDVMGASRSRGGRYLAVSINQDSTTATRLLDASTHDDVALPSMPARNLSGLAFSADDTRLAFYLSDSRMPGDLHVVDLPGGTPRALTRALNPAIDAGHLVDGEVVRFTSYDGMEIPGVLYRPHGASEGSKVPMLVRVHGGPGGQARIGYSGQNQYLLNSGYAIFDINNRGSSGYGKSFFAADDRCHGECDLGDVVAAKDFLIGLGWVDPDRVGIIGGSYGGYMVLAALAFQPEVFDVGVNIFGVSNWVRTLESIPPWWEAQRVALYNEMGDPATDSERLHRISPLFHAANIVRPLMVLQGANDPRVLQVESDEIVDAVRANDVPVEYVLFPDEGHGFVRRENEIEAYRRIREFLDEHLGNG